MDAHAPHRHASVHNAGRMSLAPMADRFEPLPEHRVALWAGYPGWDGGWFPGLVGLLAEEIRLDYCRLRLPFRDELQHPGGVVHGGAIATLVDSVVVPAVGSAYDELAGLLTVNMVVQYLGAVVGEDMVAEGWVTKRGRSTVFCRAEVRTEGSGLVATGDLVYAVRQKPAG